MIITTTLTKLEAKGVKLSQLVVWGAEVHGRNVIIDDRAPGFISFARATRDSQVFVPSRRQPTNAAATARRAALEAERMGVKPALFSPTEAVGFISPFQQAPQIASAKPKGKCVPCSRAKRKQH